MKTYERWEKKKTACVSAEMRIVSSISEVVKSKAMNNYYARESMMHN